MAVDVDAKTRDHFCSVQLGQMRCKTPSVKAQCWPSWNYKVKKALYNNGVISKFFVFQYSQLQLEHLT